MSHRTNLLRNLCLALPRVCKSIARRGVDDDGVRRILDDPATMTNLLQQIAQVTRHEIDHIIKQNQTEAPMTPATPNDSMTIFTVAEYG
ncbi:hypothetical protein [Pseudotabrizicola alkalilacus]|uniref:hypothetical protein n=1 Tax=Pseudotabrizicola alkalilacus TaxID=2305252 RepID=UPI0011C155B0|nr:hypothetical protein [Pseudotabrizicola alkalilacus]